MKINPNFKKITIKAVKEGGKILEKHFGEPVKISYKRDSSLVSDIDFKVEKAIIKIIKKNFPSHNILSEESGGKIREKYTWVIDPLDGTTNYTRKFLFFSISIALFCNREPILGVVFNPLNKELYFAEKGRGAEVNGKRIRIGRARNFSESVLILGKGRAKKDFLKLHKVLKKIGSRYRTFKFWGSTSLELCYLASGRIDGYINIGSKLHDYVAGALIVEEAGGQVTDFKGEKWQIETKNIIASNKKNNKLLLNFLK